MSLRPDRPRLRLLASLVTAAALTASLSACSLLDSVFPPQAQRDADTNEVAEAGQADAFSLVVGDCFNDDPVAGEEISSVPAVPCTDPHDNEIYATFDLTDASFPGDEAITAEADAGCEAQFEPFMGIAYADSAIYYSYLTPTEGSWKNSDREVVCFVYGDEPTTGTLGGTGL